MNCPKCKNPINDNSQECEWCGCVINKTEEEKANTTSNNNLQEKDIKNNTDANKPFKNYFFYFIMIIIVLIIFIYGKNYYYYGDIFPSHEEPVEQNFDSLNVDEGISIADTTPNYGSEIESYEEDSLTSVKETPETSERILTRSEIEGYSGWELRIMRNEIYAKHGYIFKSEDLSKYFNKKSWYEPRFNDVSDQLTPIEKENVTIIKSME
jgi:hypothetical protein